MMMFRSSSPSAGAQDSSTRTWSISSRGSTVSMPSSSSSGTSNDHQQRLHHDDDEEEVVAVAVGKEVKECKANLIWVLSNMDAILGNNDKQRKNKAKVLLLHIHRPAKTIPFMGANFPADQLHESEVAAFRHTETEMMNRTMAKYRVICARVKVPAVCKVAIEDKDDLARGIMNLVAENGITRLVIGAAADKRYSRKLTAPTSKTALSVQQQAPPTCSIWFLCKGNHVCTRLVISRAGSRKSDQDRKGAAGHHQVQLGTFLQEEPCSSSISYQQQQQLPSAAAGEMMHIRYEQKQDIRTIFAEAEKLRRENQPLMSQADEQQQLIDDLQAKLSEAHCMLFSLERDQVCSALVFLHQNNMVHGNLKPTNILLNEDGLTAKLTDYGLCRLLEPHDAGAVMLRCSATSLAYMDPKFLATGELRPSSDVYALGVLLLWLLTGRPAMGLVKQVQAALAEGSLPHIIDASAGYPQEQAHQLAHLAVKCCQMSSTNRPDLAGEMVTQALGCYLLHP